MLSFCIPLIVVLCQLPTSFGIINGITITTVIPYLFSVRNQTTEDAEGPGWGFKCSAVLINPSSLLSVQSCVAKADGEAATVQEYWQLSVVGGGLDITDVTHEGVHKSSLQSVILHKDYKPKSQHANIAILFMAIPVPMDSVHVKPINRVDKSPAVGTKVIIQGWGTGNSEETSQFTPTQREGHAKIVSREECSASVSGLPDGTLCDKSVSLGGQCTGDEGGAMVVDGKLAGILLKSDFCDTSAVPGVAIDVASYEEWIHDRSLAPGLLIGPWWVFWGSSLSLTLFVLP